MKHLLEFAKFKNIATTTDPDMQKILDAGFEWAKLTPEVYIKDWDKTIRIEWYNTYNHIFLKRLINRTSFYSVPDFNNVFEYGLNEILPYEINNTITDSGSYALHFNNHKFYLIVQINYDNLLGNDPKIFAITIVSFPEKKQDIIEIYGD